jgi:hypothetical protein
MVMHGRVKAYSSSSSNKHAIATLQVPRYTLNTCVFMYIHI